MSVITTNRKHLWCNYKDKVVRQRLAGIAVNLRSADRFVIAGDLQKSIANVSFEQQTKRFSTLSIMPYLPLIICGLRQRRTRCRLEWRAAVTDTLSKLGGTYNVQGGYLNDYNVIAKTNENIIVITKYIKFSKMQNPSSLSKNMGIEEK